MSQAITEVSGMLMRVESFVRQCLSRIRAFVTSRDISHLSQEPLTNPAQPDERIVVLALTHSKQIRDALERVALDESWRFLCAGTWREAVRLVESRSTGVVLVDRALLGGYWRDALQALLQPAHRCCVIFLRIGEGHFFCDEFLEHGGYKVLKTLLQRAEVIEGVHSAWLFWKHCICRAYHY